MTIINVINLPHRTDRLANFELEAHTQNFKYRVWDGIVIEKNLCKGVTMAHKQIVGCAKNRNASKVIIAEDDCRFFAAGALDYYLKNTPKDYDIYFSMIYSGTINESNRITEGYSGNTLYTVHKRFYDYFLSIPDDCHVDRFLGESADRHKYIVCPKFVCYQDGSFSDRVKSSCDYSPMLEGRKLFGYSK